MPHTVSDLALLDAYVRLKRRASHIAAQELKSLGIGMQQAAILFHLLSTGSASLAELARAISADPAAITRAVASLTRQALVARADHPSDRRRSQVSLSAKGRRVARDIQSARARIARELYEPLSGPDRKLLLSLFDQLDAKESSA